jgi:hypothetical protein
MPSLKYPRFFSGTRDLIVVIMAVFFHFRFIRGFLGQEQLGRLLSKTI